MLKGIQRATGTIWQLNFGCLVLLFLVCTLISTRSDAQPNSAHPLKQDENCLACHGSAGMTSASGKSISVDPARHAASVHGTLGVH